LKKRDDILTAHAGQHHVQENEGVGTTLEHVGRLLSVDGKLR